MKKILLSILLISSLNAFCYDFSLNDKNYSYNEDELKFYSVKNDKKTLLSPIEVGALFPDYEIILISNFDSKKKIKVKNSALKSKKVLLLNDTNYRTFHLFSIFPISSRDEFQGETKIKSLITIYGKKNVRLKHPGGDEFEIIPR